MIFFISILSSVFSYVNLDPMKSCFFLIVSLIFTMPLLSFSLHIWFSYFVCLLFLSGVFVILVYFSSLSKINFVKSFLVLFSFFFSLFFMSFKVNYFFNDLNMNMFYYEIYNFIIFFIIVMLLFFLNFSSYYLNFSGALRKV